MKHKSMIPATVRVYTRRPLNVWTTEDEQGRTRLVQEEFAYRDYDPETGAVVAVGSEDFSPARCGLDMAEAWVWTWDGARRNRGGHRWFACEGLVTYRKRDRAALREYLRTAYPGAVEIQLR